jgi:cytochrome P450
LSDVIPPFPARPSKPLPPHRLLLATRRNVLEIWDESAFELPFFSTRILMQKVHVCNSPDTVKYALLTANASFERKSPQMRHALEPLLGDGIFVSDGETWKSRRPAVAAVVHQSKINLFAPIMVETAQEMVQRWNKLPRDQPVDVLSEMAHLTSEIISRTIFGRRLGSRRASEIVEGFTDYQRTVGQLDFMSLLGLPDWLPRLQGLSVKRSTRRILAVLEETIRESRSAAVGEEPSLLQLLNAASVETTGRPLDADALRNEAAVLFMAGHETTANSLAWTWYLLSQAPDVEARLHEEVDRVLEGGPPSLALLDRLVYTRAVFEESMRLYPPVPILTRQAMCDEQIRRRRVEAGSLVLVAPWLLHRHRRLWDKPDHFMPDRFLPENAASRDRFSYIPFAVGPRVCAGMAFALTEAVLCLAVLAQRFTLRLRPGTVVEPVARLTLRPRGGLPMSIHPRAATSRTAPPQAEFATDMKGRA